jgi:hypothetical protein
MEEKAMPGAGSESVEYVESSFVQERRQSQIADQEAEHHLTIQYVWKHHKAIFGWSLFWGLCAIGWYANLLSSPNNPR